MTQLGTRQMLNKCGLSVIAATLSQQEPWEVPYIPEPVIPSLPHTPLGLNFQPLSPTYQ